MNRHDTSANSDLQYRDAVRLGHVTLKFSSHSGRGQRFEVIQTMVSRLPELPAVTSYRPHLPPELHIRVIGHMPGIPLSVDDRSFDNLVNVLLGMPLVVEDGVEQAVMPIPFGAGIDSDFPEMGLAPHPSLFHHPRGSQVGWITFGTDPVRPQLSEAEAQQRFQRLGHVPVSPVLASQSVAEIEAPVMPAFGGAYADLTDERLIRCADDGEVVRVSRAYLIGMNRFTYRFARLLDRSELFPEARNLGIRVNDVEG